MNIAKILLETALETNGSIRSCPIEYLKEKNKWIFWNETWADHSKEYDSFEEVLNGFDIYCKQYLDTEIQKRQNNT
jgi:hypothetical protein